MPTVRLKLPAPVDSAEVPRIKLRVSAGAKRQLAGSVLRFPLQSGGEASVPLEPGCSVTESVTPAKLEASGLSPRAAGVLSSVLQRGLGDWIWNAQVTVCNYAAMAAMEPQQAHGVYPIASVGAEQRVHYSIRCGETELVNMTVGRPPEELALGADWLFPNVGVVAGRDGSVLAVRERLGDGSVRVQTEKGEERVLRSEELRPAAARKPRERVMVLQGKYSRRCGRVVQAGNELSQLQLDDDAHALVVVPTSWTARRKDFISAAQLSTMAQLHQVVSSFSPQAPAPEPAGRASTKGRPIKVKKLDPDTVVFVEKKRVKKPKKEAAKKDEPKKKVRKTEVAAAIAETAPPDDNPVPMRGSPPEWLFQKWQGAMLVKVHSFPTWPCRIGSTLDLHRFPDASQVPAAQKEAFVYFFGDKTVSWVRFAALAPWPEGSLEQQTEELAKIGVPKKHARLWRLACDEAVEWNRNTLLLPHAPPQIESEEPAPVKLQPAKRALAKGREPTTAKEWLESLTCGVCSSGERDDLILLCDNAVCTAAIHTFCCDPPLQEVPAGSWFCPLHDAAQKVYCGACKKGDNEDLILLCDVPECKSGYHLYCLKPALDTVPAGQWSCPEHEAPALAPPRSAYALFTQEAMGPLQRERPEAGGEELARLLAERWEAGGNERKTVFAIRAADERFAYERARGIGAPPPLERAPKRRAMGETVDPELFAAMRNGTPCESPTNTKN